MMCGNIHWITTPNLARTIQIDPWPGGPKSYLWQTAITSPVKQLSMALPSLFLCPCCIEGITGDIIALFIPLIEGNCTVIQLAQSL